MYAVSMGMVEEVKFMLLKGAGICMIHKDGKAALDISLNAGHSCYVVERWAFNNFRYFKLIHSYKALN